MIKKSPERLLAVIGGYFLLSSILLCGAVLSWTYFSTKKTIDFELKKSFEQRYKITTTILHGEAERIDTAIYEMLHDDRFISFLSRNGPDEAKGYFESYIDKHPRARCDLLFIQRPDSPVWVDVSSPVPDVQPILASVSAASRDFLKKGKIARFKRDGADLTGLFKAEKLVKDDGEVFGIIVAGTILNANMKLINTIKKKTDSEMALLFQDKELLTASSAVSPSIVTSLVENFPEGALHYTKASGGTKIGNMILSHFGIKLFDEETRVGVIFSVDNSAMKKLNKAYLGTPGIILVFFGIFLFATFMIIRHRIYPSIEKLLDYTERITLGYDRNVTFEPGAILELNTIGTAMEKMVESIQKAQADLEESEKRFRLIAENAADVIWIMDMDLRLQYISPSIYLQRGFSAEEALNFSVEDMVAPDSLGVVARLYSEKLAMIEAGNPEGVKPITFEVELYHKDGSTIWSSNNARILLNRHGKPEKILGITCDITSRVNAEKALKESEYKYRALFESSMDAILLVDPKNGYLDCNQAALDMFQVDSKERFISLKPVDLSPQYQPDGQLSSKKAKDAVDKAMKNGSCFFEWKHRRMDGEEFYATILATRLNIGGQTILQGTIRDITEYKRNQEMMVQSEKMLSVGGLAAGMAHEINNPLAGIMQTADVMARRLGKTTNTPANIRAAEKAGTTIEAVHAYMESRDIPRMLETLIVSGNRVADIVNNMLSFARKSEAAASSYEPGVLIDKTLELAATDYDIQKKYDFKTIEIIKEYEPDLPLIICEYTKIQQVLLNILRNGAQAMQSAHNNKDRLHQFTIRLTTDKPNRMLRIEISDNGPGMDEATRKRVFEPFFTTKPTGSGTGLGLSVSYFIITENHNGTMDVISEPDKGATFIICLPFEETSGQVTSEAALA